jgi:hypothetical protein
VEQGLKDPGACPSGQPPVSIEPCLAGDNVFVEWSYFGFEDGRGDTPWNTFGEAYVNSPDSSTLYLQPGSYLAPVHITLDRPMTIAGPGGAELF